LPEILPPKAPLPAETGRGKRRAAAAQEPAPRPHHHVLLELAMTEKRPDDVLKWYDLIAADRRGYFWGNYAERVADAVAEKHPDRALDIYRREAEADIARVSPSAYEEALGPLRKMRALLRRLGRGAEWEAHLKKLRTDHARKRRLIETLDRLEGRPIVED
jgi:uncharacterized Zn finger protein